MFCFVLCFPSPRLLPLAKQTPSSCPFVHADEVTAKKEVLQGHFSFLISELQKSQGLTLELKDKLQEVADEKQSLEDARHQLEEAQRNLEDAVKMEQSERERIVSSKSIQNHSD